MLSASHRSLAMGDKKRERSVGMSPLAVFIAGVAAVTATACMHPRPATQIPAQSSLPVPGTVQGLVLWNEQPVMGARVHVTSEYDFRSTQYGSVTTDARGRFSISGVPDGKKYLYVLGNQPAFWVAA